ncbi:T9SS type A sorting domain-containing protein [Neolewinella antarctica]|uniref:Secretion system C-terminal sorting domain-containing protein n=1 Tax=Neolewinella antarctica TaxID=442734 RepID=A0ABX0XCF7_9BACT|nr:T9SS type A sorting domain-containing protein [Neolewinella antarctica]NJC26941.1 hypothetical protein [Neolewinella antarctica]
MNKFYLFICLAFCLGSPSLRAQTCSTADFTNTLPDRIRSIAATNPVYQPGSTLEICGNSTGSLSNLIGFSGFNDGSLSRVVIYELTPTGYEIYQVVTTDRSAPVDLDQNTPFSIVIEFGTPVTDQPFEFSYTSRRNSPDFTGTIAGRQLPVELLSFTGEPTKKGVNLQWETASESGNEGFQIERSGDASEWVDLGFVNATAKEQSGATYGFRDEAPLTGAAFYRFKQLDFDGQFAYSPIVRIDYVSGEALQVFPNPANESLNLRIGDAEGTFQAVVTDQMGRRVIERNVANVGTLDLGSLASGVYQVTVIGERTKLTRRFLKN